MSGALATLLLVGLLAEVAGADARMDLMNDVASLRRSRDLDGAERHLVTWIDAHPGDGDARLLLGQVLVDANREAEALRVWTAMLLELPVDVDRYRVVSARMRSLGRAQQALALLEDGRRRAGGDDLFAWERAQLLLTLARFDEAVEAHLSLLRQEPHRRPLVENRIAALARGDLGDGPDDGGRRQHYCDALGRAHERALAGDDRLERTTSALLVASCALETGRPRRGLDALRAGLDDSTVLQAVFQFATRCEALGYADEAAAAYALFAAHGGGSPYRFRSLLKQAEMREVVGDVDEAIELYAQLADDYPRRDETVEALLRVARLQAEVQGAPEQALVTLAGLEGRARSGAPRRRLLLLRADCHVRLDDLAAARSELERLGQDPESSAEADFGLARLAFYEGDLDSSAARVDSLVTRSPSHPVANDALDLLLLIDEFTSQPGALAVLARARLRHRQGRAHEAEADWEWLMVEAPPSLRAVARLERARLLEPRDAAGALELFEQALADDGLGERHALSAALGRARLLEARGDAGAALRAYEEALLRVPLDPRSPEIRRQIERLRGLLGARG